MKWKQIQYEHVYQNFNVFMHHWNGKLKKKKKRHIEQQKSINTKIHRQRPVKSLTSYIV